MHFLRHASIQQKQMRIIMGFFQRFFSRKNFYRC